MHTDLANAKTAEAVMRARYSAYVVGNVSFLKTSIPARDRGNFDAEATKKWAANSTWLGLEVLHTHAGQPSDNVGIVEFKAYYVEDGEEFVHEEIAYFEKFEERWYFTKGELPHQGTRTNDSPKVGRNDPCPCGSGKKYKKCCG